MKVSTKPYSSNFPLFPKKKDAPLDETVQQQPKEEWAPLTLGSSLGAVMGAGLTATAAGSGLTAGLVGFGTTYLAGKLLNIDRYEGPGLFLFGTMTATTVAAAYAAGPVGLALLAGAGVAAYAVHLLTRPTTL